MGKLAAFWRKYKFDYQYLQDAYRRGSTIEVQCPLARHSLKKAGLMDYVTTRRTRHSRGGLLMVLTKEGRKRAKQIEKLEKAKYRKFMQPRKRGPLLPLD